MLAPVVALLLAASPQVVVIKRTSVGVSETAVARVVLTLLDELTKAGIEAREAPGTCGPERVCLASTAQLAKAAAALGVTIVRSRRDLTIDLEAVDDSEHPLGLQTFSVPLSGQPFPPAASAFFASLAAAVVKPAADAPRAVQLEPPPSDAPIVIQRSNTAGHVAAVSTLVVGATAIGLLVAGMVMRGSLETKLRPPNGIISGPRADAERQAGQVNAVLTGSLVATVVALASGGAAILLWDQGPSSAETR